MFHVHRHWYYFVHISNAALSFRQLKDRAGMGRAFGNIGNAYSAMGYYEQAIKYHKQELTISKVQTYFLIEHYLYLSIYYLFIYLLIYLSIY